MIYGVALEGGGAKGAYHSGALKALDEIGISIGGVAGTSIGAINGAYYLQVGSQALIEFWETLDPSYLFPENLELIQERLKDERSEDVLGLLKEIRETIASGGLSVDPFKETLKRMIDEKVIRQSGKSFGLVTYSITDFKPVRIMLKDMEEGRLLDFLLATAYLPGFKREKISGKSYIDGGFYDNLPVNLLIENGFEHIIAIELLGKGLKKKAKKNCDLITIKPSEDVGSLLNFQLSCSKKNIQMGYYDTLRVFNDYYGQWFYLSDIWSPNKAFDWMKTLSKEKIKRLCQVSGFKVLPSPRNIFEDFVPMWVELLKIPQKANYNMILLYVLEFIGKVLEIDRFKVLTMDKLVEEIQSHMTSHIMDDNQEEGVLTKRLKTTKIYAHLNKDEIALEWGKILFD